MLVTSRVALIGVSAVTNNRNRSYLMQCGVAMSIVEVDVQIWVLDQEPSNLLVLAKSSIGQ